MVRTNDGGIRDRVGELSPDRLVRSTLGRAYPYVHRGTLSVLRSRVLHREELRRRASREGSLLDYGEPETYELQPPATPDDLEGRVAERVGTHRLPRPFVGELRDCRLLGAYPLAVTDREEFVMEAAVRPTVLVLNLLGSARELAANPSGLRDLRSDASLDVACPLFNYWSSGYFHWTYESLIRLQGVERYREATGRTPTLVLGPDPPAWQRESLALLGYGAGDWVEWDRRAATVDRLVVPSVRRTSVLSPAAVEWLRERVTSRLRADGSLPDPQDTPDRVYVSRADADRRRVENEDAVVRALSEFGFERFVLSELSVPEQAALFAGAEVVVAPHGAGLTNLTFADDAAVVELFRAGDVRGQYFQLAGIRGLEYHYRVADSVGEDMRVDVEELRALVNSVLG